MDESRIAAVAERVSSGLRVGRFPAKATDYNKLPDVDGFWKLSVQEAERNFAMSFRPKDMGDIIMFLNGAASSWEATRKGGA